MTPYSESEQIGKLKRRLKLERAVLGTLVVLLALGYLLPFGEETPPAPKRAPGTPPVRFAILADGKVVAGTGSEKDARAALDEVKAHYASLVKEISEEPRFKQKVEVARRPVPDALFRATPKEVAELLSAPTASGVHVVESGDTAWKIAHKAGVRVEELEAWNPGARLAHLSIGDRIRLSKAEGAGGLTVVTKEVSRDQQRVRPRVERQRSPNMYEGKQMVLSPGASGLREVTQARVYENGLLVKSETESEKQIRAPKIRRVVVGTKPRP
ncbi:MAG TPA: G5 domain-containing protein [Armatimonadota bacterium]|jgi:LysM repeat protein